MTDFVTSCLKLNPDDVCKPLLPRPDFADELVAPQRPTAAELLKTKFVKSAPRGSDRLFHLIMRQEKWKREKKSSAEADSTLVARG